MLFWLGIGLMLWGLAAMGKGVAWAIEGAVGWFLLSEGVGSLLAGTGAALAIHGRRAMAADVGQVQRRDPRPPILYLRGFHDDVLSERERPIPEGWSAPAALWSKTSEEALVQQFRDVGPVIGLGQPHEIVPTGGAARHYLRAGGPGLGAGAPNTWQHWIEAQLARSQLAIINWNPAPSESLRWELSTALAVLGRHRVLIWFPQPGDWAAFCADPQVTLPKPALPVDVLLLGFAEDGQPVIRQARGAAPA